MRPHSTRAARFMGIAVAAAILMPGHVFAADAFELAKDSGCLVCHRGASKKIGPAFSDVARKYAGRADAMAVIAAHIVNGTGPAGLGWMNEGKAALPTMPANSNVTPENAARLAKWILGIDGEIMDRAKFVTENVSVTGLVKHPLKLSVRDLQQYPVQELAAPVMEHSGAGHRKPDNFKGVLLRDLLLQAVVASDSPFDVKKTAIIVTASDGYKVVYSWSEVFKSPIGDGAMVFFEKNGQPLSDDEGRLGMVSVRDASASSRYVKWLKTIEVRKIVD